jgi:hypothetical protein
MKTINLFLIYIMSFMLFFFILSAIGMLWGNSYHTCISDGAWFIIYALFIGSWMSVFPAREYYLYNEEYFDRVF